MFRFLTYFFELIKPNLKGMDGDYSSRKFWISAGAVMFIFLNGVLAAAWAKFGTYLSELTNTYIIILGMYLGANVGTKYFVTKTNPGVSFNGEMPGQQVAARPAAPVTPGKATEKQVVPAKPPVDPSDEVS